MPGFITHLMFGEEAIKDEEKEVVKLLLKDHIETFGLGLQGPDIFFYFVPAYLFHEQNIGNRMHRENVMLFFDALFSSRNQFESEKNRRICDAYICGFMGHYTLDVFSHPYVYYRSNHFHAVETKGGAFDFGNHVSLETDIDHEVLMHFKGLLPTQFEYGHAIKPNKQEIKVIGKLLSRAINHVYDEKITPASIELAINNFSLLNSLMRDPNSVKKHTVRCLEEPIFKCATISAMIPSNTKLKFKDPCNTEHRTWKNPWDDSKSSTDSIFDIMEKSKNVYKERIDLYLKSVDEGVNLSTENYISLRNKLLANLSDLSYCTGLPL